MSTRPVVPALFHLTPLIPLALGYGYGAIAAVLLVTLPYIKTKKLGAHLAELNAVPVAGRGEVLVKEMASLRRAQALWWSLTFLPPLDAPSDSRR